MGMGPDFPSEIVRFIDVFSHLNKLSTLQKLGVQRCCIMISLIEGSCQQERYWLR